MLFQLTFEQITNNDFMQLEDEWVNVNNFFPVGKINLEYFYVPSLKVFIVFSLKKILPSDSIFRILEN